ncbi:unnamed protein product [Orchesella dallaii]|uniref:ADP-ribosylhydrolase ARH3 n=1 Tax=Orchesella dallaii TaxID=48710 RepID=A0ABP1Q976_9HEXA
MERHRSSTDLLIQPGHQDSHKILKMETEQTSKKNNSFIRIRDKFRGALLGALVGDCIGTLFERDYSVSYTLLEELYHSLTNLSEDEKLMDLHGIDLSLGPKRVREILETKRQSYASLTGQGGKDEDEGDDDDDDAMDLSDKFLKKHHEGALLRRNSAVESSISADTALSRRGSLSRPIERYSDDTVMTKSVLNSLIHSKGFDARHLAKQLTEDFFLNMNRKFGGYIRDIFVQLRENGYGDPYGPAKKYSGGMGAQGNEAASRVSPIALFCWNHNEQQSVVDFASKLAKITNAHRTSVHGTVLQALAVHAAFNWDLKRETYCCVCGGKEGGEPHASSSSRHGSPLLLRRRQSAHGSKIELQPRVQVEQQPKYFCEQVLEKMNLVEGRASSLFENLKQFMHHSSSYKEKEFLRPAEPTYCDKLRVTLEFLARSQPPTRIEVIERLGNGNKAIDSVPTAIYSFLFATKHDMLPEMSTPIKSPVLRCIFHAISLGGETDTVAAMAGAIAGAYWGYSQIPNEILRVCEGWTEILKLADELFNMTYKNNACPSCQQCK